MKKQENDTTQHNQHQPQIEQEDQQREEEEEEEEEKQYQQEEVEKQLEKEEEEAETEEQEMEKYSINMQSSPQLQPISPPLKSINNIQSSLPQLKPLSPPLQSTSPSPSPFSSPDQEPASQRHEVTPPDSSTHYVFFPPGLKPFKPSSPPPSSTTRVDVKTQKDEEEEEEEEVVRQVEESGGGRERKLMPNLSILRKVKRENIKRKALLGFRSFGFAFCLVSFSVMAADKNQGWALDSFNRYKEFRYCMSVNVIGFVYSGLQVYDLAYALTARKHVVRTHLRHLLDFSLDQTLTYLLLSASSSASFRVEDWEANWGKDKFPTMARASVTLSFLAFVAFALGSLISGYTLFTPNSW